MKRNELSSKMVGRILNSVLTYGNVSNLVYEALDFGMYSIQIFPNMIPKVLEVLDGRKLEICAVIAYPHGTFTPEQKAFEIEDAIAMGATQVEVAPHNLNIRSEEWEKVREEIRACRKAAGNHVFKYIIESEFLSPEHICQVAQIAKEEKVDQLVTSIGVYDYINKEGQLVPFEIMPEDIKIIKDVVGNEVDVVAQGLVNSLEKAKSMLQAGADFISSEEAAAILRLCER